MCDHDYEYQGLRWANGHNPLPGTGATRRYFSHFYYCRKCLDKKYESAPEINGETSYWKTEVPNASQGPVNEIVPEHDKSPF